MQSPHRTILTYFYVDDGGRERELEVGEVAAVPRKGENVHLETQYVKGCFVVERVQWSPDRDCEWLPGTRERPKMITWVAATLMRDE